MIKISRMADYGIVLLTAIANQVNETSVTAKDLSGDSGLPLPMVSKVLKLLAKEGLLTSQRGAKGGYSLARDAKKITVADIVTILDGPIVMADCLNDSTNRCSIKSNCTIKNYWKLVNDKIINSLQTISLADLTCQCIDTNLHSCESTSVQ